MYYKTERKMRFEDQSVYTCTFTNANSTHGKPDH